MAFLLDGYNLLNVSEITAPPGAGTALHRARWALLQHLAASLGERERGQTTIIFDAAGAPPGLPSVTSHAGMTVRFARRHADADELIEELLEAWREPKSLTVVSSDHRVQRAARRYGASYVDSETWLAELSAAQRRQVARSESSAKPETPASADEVAFWLGEFAKGPPRKKKHGI